MSATEELRRLLDERGIKWEAPNNCLRDEVTQFTVRGRFGAEWYCADETYNGGMLGLYAEWYDELTPADVAGIAQGRGECRNAETREGYFACSGCGYAFSSWGGFGCDCGDEPDFRYCPNCGRRVAG